MGLVLGFFSLQRRKKSACRDNNWLCPPCSRSTGGKRNPVIILSAHGLHNIWHQAAGKMKACLLTASFVLAAFTPGNKLIHSAVFCIIVDTVLIGAIRFPVSTCPSCYCLGTVVSCQPRSSTACSVPAELLPEMP